MKMVLRGAFSQIGIGLALGIPAAIGAGKLMNESTLRRQAMGPNHARAGCADARPGCTAGVGNPGAACRRRRAHGGTAKWIMQIKCHPHTSRRPSLDATSSRFEGVLPSLRPAPQPTRPRPGNSTYASARFMLLMASSISCVLLKPMVAQSTPAFWKANLIAFTRSS